MKKLIILSLLLMSVVCAFADRKALVISNTMYEKLSLANAANDADLVEEAFSILDFSVTRARDLDYQGMLAALDKFKGNLRSGDVAVFYFAGFAEQQCGKNYLLPYAVKDKGNEDEENHRISVDVVLEALTRATESFVFLETRQAPGSIFSMFSKNKGLAPITNLAKNQSFAMTQAPNRSFTDRKGEFSFFTYTLLNKLSSEMIDFKELMSAVSEEVKIETKGAQIPYWKSDLVAPFSFYQPLQPYKSNFKLPPFKNLKGGGSYNF